MSLENSKIGLTDSADNVINPSQEDGNLLSVKTNTDKLDVNLSTRATETTLSGIKAQTDNLTFTGSDLNVKVTSGGAGGSVIDDDDGNIAAGQTGIDLNLDLLYGYNGVNWERVKSSSGRLIVDGSQVTQPISAVSLPLPTGAATETTLSTRLADTTFTSRINTLGQKAMVSSTPVVLASDQSAIPITDNGSSLTVDGTVDVNLQDGSGNDITSTAGSLNVNITGGAAAATEQHTVDSGSDLYIDGTTKGVLAASRVVDTNSPPSLAIGRFSALTLDTSGNLNVRIASSTATNPSAVSISDFVKDNKVYTVAINLNQALAGADNPLLLVRNLSGSGKVFYFYRVQLGINVSNVNSNFIVWANPTVTAFGTARTPISNNIGGGAPAATMLVNSLPTVSSTGSRITNYTVGQNTNSFNSLEDFSLFVQPNNSILITGNPSSNNREASLTITWVEV